MFLIIQDSKGVRHEGFLLAVSENRMRVAVPHRNDVVELRSFQGQWSFEDGEPAEIESLLNPGGTHPLTLRALPYHRVA